MDAGTERECIEAAVAALRRGELVGLPTETVYGLAADAGNAEAVRKVFALKGRPADHPLIVHVAGVDALATWSRGEDPRARNLAKAFWPGPLTLVLPRAPQVLDLVTGGQDSIGLRCPNHPLALALLRAFGGGLAAPSANRFGRISPTTAAHVREEFPEGLALVLDGGDCEIGLESTIIDLTAEPARLLRPGRISVAQVEALIGPLAEAGFVDAPRASGTLEAHYAPGTPMLLLPREALAEESRRQAAFGKVALLLARGSLPEATRGLALPADAAGFGHGLYAALRSLDALGANLLLVERPPDGPDWAAANDRLRRSAAGAGVDAGADAGT